MNLSNVLKATWYSIMEHKKGVFAGGIIGAATAYYVQITNNDIISQITGAGKGLIDAMMSRSAPVDVATTKLYVTYILVGAVMGYLVALIFNRFGGTKVKSYFRRR